MKTDKELQELTYGIAKIYENIENELLMLIAKKFDIYESVGVSRSLEWYLKKLNDLGGLNNEAIRIISQYSNMTEKEIISMLKKAGYANFDIDVLNKAYKVGQIGIDPAILFTSDMFNNTINNSFVELKNNLQLINTKALESTKQAYMDVLNKAYIETSGGIYDYNTSIKKALQEMTDKGITGASYQRKNGSIVKYNLEATVRRDVLTAVVQTANRATEAMSKEMKAEYYEVSSHMGARTGDGINPITDHGHWQGKVYKINGFDEKYDNFYTQTGYGDILGLGGVNCRHRFWPFFPGISVRNPIQVNEQDNKKAYNLSQKQRYLENQVRKYKKRINLAKVTNDEELLNKSKKKLKLKQKQLNKFVIDHNLRRDYGREYVVQSKGE